METGSRERRGPQRVQTAPLRLEAKVTKGHEQDKRGAFSFSWNSKDGLIQPGETVRLVIEVLNAGAPGHRRDAGAAQEPAGGPDRRRRQQPGDGERRGLSAFAMEMPLSLGIADRWTAC